MFALFYMIINVKTIKMPPIIVIIFETKLVRLNTKFTVKHFYYACVFMLTM